MPQILLRFRSTSIDLSRPQTEPFLCVSHAPPPRWNPQKGLYNKLALNCWKIKHFGASEPVLPQELIGFGVLIEKLIVEAIPESEPKPTDLLIKTLIRETIPESEAKPIYFLIVKLIGEAVPESEPTSIDFPMKKLIGEAIPESEAKPNDFLVKKLIWGGDS